MKKLIFTITILALSIFTAFGQKSAPLNNTEEIDLIYDLLINGPSSLSTDIGDYYIDNLPTDITDAHWIITDNSNLNIVADNGVNGCRIEHLSFKSFDAETSSFIDVYHEGESELIFEFAWNDDIYSVLKTITFENIPDIESNAYSITANPMTKELVFTNLANSAQCKPERGTVLFIDLKTGATVFQQSYNFCSSFSIATHTIPNGLYAVNMVMNGQKIKQKNIFVYH